MRGAVTANKAREYFVTRAESTKVLETCPNAQWRLIFALSRFGGLRCPSELLVLRWGDIDWHHSRMTVHSPKTAHHVGKESRIVPIFPELKPYLEECFEAAADGTEFVITQYRRNGLNLRTQLERIILRAGLKPWPKLFQNMRASRATELAAEFPAHVAADWLGHSTLVAQKHYWRTQDSDFAKATTEPVESRAASNGATDAKTALQNEEKQPAAGAAMHRNLQRKPFSRREFRRKDPRREKNSVRVLKSKQLSL